MSLTDQSNMAAEAPPGFAAIAVSSEAPTPIVDACQTSKRGRPDRQGSIKLDARILSTAARAFVEQGYDGASMGQIAADAGAGKQSLYRRYPNKEALFQAAFTDVLIKDGLARWRDQLGALSTSSPFAGDRPLETLRQVVRAAFDFTLEPKTIEVFRLFVGERGRFPRLKVDARRMVRALEGQIARHIREAQHRGVLGADIHPFAARNLMALIYEGPLARALLGLPSLGTKAKRDKYFDFAWRSCLESVDAQRRPILPAA